MTDDEKQYEPDNWDKFGAFVERMWIRWYSWGRDWRYRRTVRKLAKLMATEWEKKYESDPTNNRFSIVYFASEKRQYGMSDNDYVLNFFVHGFSRENKVKAINHIERLLWIRFNMHPAEVFNRVMVPEIERQIIHEIVNAMPTSIKERYIFFTEELPYYSGDWEMRPDTHWLYKMVAVRKDD